MIDVLVTYLPLSRTDEIKAYFTQNVDIISPKKVLIYVDTRGEEPEFTLSLPFDYRLVFGDWWDRNLCWLKMLRDFRAQGFDNILVVDSDNTLNPDFQRIDKELLEAGHGFYTVLDTECPPELFINSSNQPKRLGSTLVRYWEIFKLGRNFFDIGSKQAVRLDARFLDKIEPTLIKELESIMSSLPPHDRNYIKDEWTLGVLAYNAGYRYVPWVVGSTHHPRPKENSRIQEIRAAEARVRWALRLTRTNGWRALAIATYYFGVLVSSKLNGRTTAPIRSG